MKCCRVLLNEDVSIDAPQFQLLKRVPICQAMIQANQVLGGALCGAMAKLFEAKLAHIGGAIDGENWPRSSTPLFTQLSEVENILLWNEASGSRFGAQIAAHEIVYEPEAALTELLEGLGRHFADS